MKSKTRNPADPRAKAKRAALNALRRAKRAADAANVELSDWEGEFLGSVEERVEKYGRAFADPDLGAVGGALSVRQGIKLKEITRKAKGGDKPKKPAKPRGSFGKAKSGGLKRRSSFGRPRRNAHGK